MKINWFKIDTEQLISLIVDFFIYQTYGSFINLCIALKQGKNCKDCERTYYSCECNFCENCKYRYCVCNLNINKTQLLYFDKKERIFANNILLKLMKYNITKDIIFIIVNNLKFRLNQLNQYKNSTHYNNLFEIKQQIKSLL